MDKNDKQEEIVENSTNFSDVGHTQNPFVAIPTNEGIANVSDESLIQDNLKGNLDEYSTTVVPNISIQKDISNADEERNRIFEIFNVRNFIAFWFIGMINNYHYCLVLSASDDMAKSFGLGKLIALITWVNVVGGIFIRLFNTFASPTTSYLRRFLYAGLMTLTGIIIVCISPYCGSNNPFKFFLLLVGVFNVGNGSNLGESVALGYMERYPSKYVGGWSSGTGFSGVLAAIIFMGMKYAGLNNSAIFGINAVFVLVYWASFYFILYIPYLNEEGAHEPRTNIAALSWKTGEIQKQTIGFKVEEDDGSLAVIDDASASSKEKSSFHTWWNSPGIKELRHWHNFILFNNVNVMLVYIFEYAIQFIVPLCFPCDTFKSSNFFLKNAFVITQFCYQFGVLFSRSSLSCVRISKVYILTIIQFIFMICWLVQSKVLFLSDKNDAQGKGELKYAIILYVWMFFVGLMGGASYVNVFHNILEQTKDDNVDPIVLKERRQLCMNIGAIYATVGITLGSILDVIFSNTAITREC